MGIHLRETRPESVILQIGSNDLPTSRANPTPVSTVVDDIIKAGTICREHGVKNVLIGGVILRRAYHLQTRCRELNAILEEKCKLHGFIFMGNDNINTSHLQEDGTHLNNDGSNILGRNYLFYLNKLNWDKVVGQGSNQG